MNLKWPIFFIFACLQCTTTEKPTIKTDHLKEVLKPSLQPKSETNTDKTLLKTDSSESLESPDSSNCIKIKETLPYWVENQQVIITKLLSKCKSINNDDSLLQQNSSWTAMSIPCTGSGKINLIGHFSAPKVISLNFHNRCLVSKDKLSVEAVGRKLLGLSKDANLVAYFPLSVEYWVFPKIQESGEGFKILLKSDRAKKELWKSFKQQPIQIQLYGRENTWEKNRSVYEVNGNIVFVSESLFRLEVKKIVVLSSERIKEIKSNCPSLSQKNSCLQFFGSIENS